MVGGYPVGEDRAGVVLEPDKLRLLAKTERLDRTPVCDRAALLAVAEHERVRQSSVPPWPVGDLDAVVVELTRGEEGEGQGCAVEFPVDGQAGNVRTVKRDDLQVRCGIEQRW
jgi:hypothetical protein